MSIDEYFNFWLGKALKKIQSKYDNLSYAVQGKIENIYEKIDHHVLIGLLSKKIEDSFFISLIQKLLKAGLFYKKGFLLRKWGCPKALCFHLL